MIAAQSIGEPGTQLTMRTFHIGGAASRTAVQSHVEAKSAGTARFTPTMRYVQQRQGRQGGDLALRRDHRRGRQPPRARAPQGAVRRATLRSPTATAGQGGQQPRHLGSAPPPDRHRVRRHGAGSRTSRKASRSPSRSTTSPGLSTLVVIDPKRRGSAAAKGVRPSVKLINEQGEEVQHRRHRPRREHQLPGGRGDRGARRPAGAVGEVLARIPQETSKTRDITGGLPRVAELFEARSPKDAGMLAEVTGTVSFGKDTKGKQRLVITDLDMQQHEYLIAKDKHVLVHDGQVVNKGEMIVDGPVDPHDLLRLLGRGGARALHHRRGAGRVPPAGREDQRQAHRGDRAPDAAARGDRPIRARPRSSPASRWSAPSCWRRTRRR